MTKFETIQIFIQGAGVVAVTLTLYVYYRQLCTMDAQRRAMEREMAARMRPWVGLFGFGLSSLPADGGESRDRLLLLLKNYGPLPAQRARLSLVLAPQELDVEPIRWEEPGEKALLPGEDGNYAIDLARYPEFAGWRSRHLDVNVDGSMQYALDEPAYQTHFRGVLRFSEAPDEDGGVRIRWRNLAAV